MAAAVTRSRMKIKNVMLMFFFLYRRFRFTGTCAIIIDSFETYLNALGVLVVPTK